jgi:ABC-type phosphate/phosphonate transport system permease subunit
MSYDLDKEKQENQKQSFKSRQRLFYFLVTVIFLSIFLTWLIFFSGSNFKINNLDKYNEYFKLISEKFSQTKENFLNDYNKASLEFSTSSDLENVSNESQENYQSTSTQQ